MLGWMILFAVMMVLLGAVGLLAGHSGFASVKMASIVFALLFLAGLLTRAARRRVW